MLSAGNVCLAYSVDDTLNSYACESNFSICRPNGFFFYNCLASYFGGSLVPWRRHSRLDLIDLLIESMRVILAPPGFMTPGTSILLEGNVFHLPCGQDQISRSSDDRHMRAKAQSGCLVISVRSKLEILDEAVVVF